MTPVRIIPATVFAWDGSKADKSLWCEPSAPILVPALISRLEFNFIFCGESKFKIIHAEEKKSNEAIG